MSAQNHLSRSSAGMRLIALLTLYNRGDFDRLREYIAQHYTPEALADQPADERAADLHDRYRALGKLRIEQVLGIGKHQAIVAVQAQHTRDYYTLQIVVEEDYPHRITLHAWDDTAYIAKDETL